MTDICCIGHITLDKIITPEREVFMNGGTAYYFASALNHLPKVVDFKLITSMSRNDKKVVDTLRASGVDVTFYPSRDTVYFENKYGDNPNHRTQRVLSVADPFTMEDLYDVDARFYHLGSLLNDDFPVELIKHLSRKGLVSVDVQGFLREVVDREVRPIPWKEMDELLPYIDILKLNEDEMVTVSGMTDPKKIAIYLASRGVKEVLITLGSQGSLIYAQNRFFPIPAYPPKKIVDATGCGDTYSTGYLYCRAQGMSYGDSGRFAAAMCTQKLEHNGPFNGTLDDIKAIITRHQTRF